MNICSRPGDPLGQLFRKLILSERLLSNSLPIGFPKLTTIPKINLCDIVGRPSGQIYPMIYRPAAKSSNTDSRSPRFT